jgi:hypothetical protein
MVDDWPMGRIVQIRWFGETAPAAIIGYDFPSNQVRVSFEPAGGNRSDYITTDRLLELNEPSQTY